MMAAKTDERLTVAIGSLLNLPGEIRSLIYDEYIAVMTIKVNHVGACVPSPLTQVCRLIRNEFLPKLTSQDCNLATASIEAKVTDWNFSPLLIFLRQLRAHYDGTPRDLTIHVDVLTPDSNYSYLRSLWIRNIWLLGPFTTSGMDSTGKFKLSVSTPPKVIIEGQHFNIKHVVHFPPSPFSIASRRSKPQLLRGMAMRGKMASFNEYLENELIDGKPTKCAEWAQSHWYTCAAWKERIRQIRAGKLVIYGNGIW